MTPVATNTSGLAPVVALTVQINNAPSSVLNGTLTDISVMTNIGNIPFQFQAEYSGLKNGHKLLSDTINGTTDNSGNAIVSWIPSLPSGQIVLDTYADVHVTATDQNGNTVPSQDVHVQIIRI